MNPLTQDEAVQLATMAIDAGFLLGIVFIVLLLGSWKLVDWFFDWLDMQAWYRELEQRQAEKLRRIIERRRGAAARGANHRTEEKRS